jgi:transposase
MGRHVKLEEKQIERMGKLRAQGVPIQELAQRFGVAKDTVYRLLKKEAVE